MRKLSELFYLAMELKVYPTNMYMCSAMEDLLEMDAITNEEYEFVIKSISDTMKHVSNGEITGTSFSMASALHRGQAGDHYTWDELRDVYMRLEFYGIWMFDLARKGQ